MYIDSHPLDHLLHQMVHDWKRLCPKVDPIEINVTAPAILVSVDEIRFRQCLANWVSYVVEYAPESCTVSIVVQEEPDLLRFFIRSKGNRQHLPPECDVTMYGYIAAQILALHTGEIQRLTQDQEGACVEFTLPLKKSAS